jgi:predicted nucleic acid-binding protein
MTQTAFVRVSSNPGIIAAAVSPREAHALLIRMMRHPAHRFWADDVSLDAFSPELLASLVGHRQVSDAYLLRLSFEHEGRLATFDRGIRGLVPERSPLHEAIVMIDG